MTDARRSMALMGLFTALWAAVELLAGGLSRSYSPYQVIFSRYLVHLLFMGAVWGWRDPGSLWRTRRPAYQLARSAMMVIMPVSFVLSLQRGIADRTILAVFAVSPLLILGLARLLLGERAAAWTWAAAAAAAAGAAVALEPDRLPAPWLAVLPLAMAGSFALYVVMTRSLRGEPTRTNLFFTAAGVAAVMALDMPRVWITPTARDGVILAAIGLLGFAALWAIDRLAARAPLGAAAPASALYVVFTVGAGAVTGQRPPSPAALGGLALVAAACAFAWSQPPAPLLEPSR